MISDNSLFAAGEPPLKIIIFKIEKEAYIYTFGKTKIKMHRCEFDMLINKRRVTSTASLKLQKR